MTIHVFWVGLHSHFDPSFSRNFGRCLLCRILLQPSHPKDPWRPGCNVLSVIAVPLGDFCSG